MRTITFNVSPNCNRYMSSVQFFAFLNHPRGLWALSEKLIGGNKKTPAKSITVSHDAVAHDLTVREFIVTVIGVTADEDFDNFLSRMATLLTQDGCTADGHYHPVEITMTGTDEYWREHPDIFI